MIRLLKTLGYTDDSEYMQNIINSLSSYKEITINEDSSVTYKDVDTTYFLENDEWHIDFLLTIKQFKKQYKKWNKSKQTVSFNFHSHNVKNEMKFFVYCKLFKEEWKLSSVISKHNSTLNELAKYINEKYPSLDSILELDIDKANFEWIDWLENKGKRTTRFNFDKAAGKEYKIKTHIASSLNQVYQDLLNNTDIREEWEKDKWDVRNLEKYGVSYNKTNSHYIISFNRIKSKPIREQVKKYFRERLLSNNKFSWGTAQYYIGYILNFFNLILELEPTWKDLKKLERKHMLQYIEWLNVYTKKNLGQKISNPSRYMHMALTIIDKFLGDIQLRESEIAPMKSVKTLILPGDKPKLKKKPYDQINYVPDYVLEQLFRQINHLHKDVIPIIWILFKTGLRISDVLGLKQDCLIRLNDSYWIVTDIRKTYVEEHRIPIDEELAKILATLIDKAKKHSNRDNNPDDLIFVKYSGSRKGKPFHYKWVRYSLNTLAKEYNITDESGRLYHFKNHAFRHTYAVKMLNNGADIITVQELLAHSSPEMTHSYAKLLDDSKRKAHDEVMQSGVFTFNSHGEIEQEITGKIPEDILDMLWTNHKLTAVDTPYGTCLQRSKGKCGFAKQPPCLTCNGGSPCKDLGVGIFEGDIKKYEIHISSTKALLEQAKVHSRTRMIEENEELLKIYEGVYNTIKNGNIVYGNLEKLKK